jgi:hypothetical protein
MYRNLKVVMQSNYHLLRITTICASLSICCFLTTSITGCTKPRQTTAVGSGVGGVVGAGLGAIIGNQSGNAGSGLAIGAGAGAAVGALVGNALQAQEERNTTQDEAIKRQERVIQAQRNEINELRSIRGDDSYSYNSSTTTPRYRYRGTATNPESPEVARQRAKLQQRGPSPRGGSSSVYSQSYYLYPSSQERALPRHVPAPPQAAPARSAGVAPARSAVSEPTRSITASPSLPAATLPAASLPSTTSSNTPREQHKPLARYDVRSDLSASTAERAIESAPPLKTAPLLNEPRKIEPPKREVESGGISESDIVAPIQKTETTAKAAVPAPALPAQSKECKEALAERDLAAESTENSDKLFHLRRALRLCPQSAPLHHELGKVYASMQRSKDAEEEFKQALSIDPSFSAAKRELGSLLKDEVQF